jgi:hypothetical protein
MQRDAVTFGIDNQGAVTMRPDLLFLFCDVARRASLSPA